MANTSGQHRGTLAVFGGAFDPPHAGHLLVPAIVLGLTEAKRILVVPAFAHPFGKKMAGFRDRLDMCQAAFAIYGRSVRVSPIEKRLAERGIPNRTVHLLDAVAAAHPRLHVRLVIGADIVDERSEWTDFDRIEHEYTPIVVGRAGFQQGGAASCLPTLPDIRSREIRASLAAGDIDLPELPRTVRALIRSRGLYRCLLP